MKLNKMKELEEKIEALECIVRIQRDVLFALSYCETGHAQTCVSQLNPNYSCNCSLGKTISSADIILGRTK